MTIEIPKISKNGWVVIPFKGIVFNNGESLLHYEDAPLKIVFDLQHNPTEETFGKLNYKQITEDNLAYLIKEAYGTCEN